MVNALTATGLAFDYPGPLRAVDGIDLRLDEGELVAVIGANGSGKSTLISLLGGLLRPSSGRVELRGEDLRGMDARERALRVAIVPQLLEGCGEALVGNFVLGGRYAHLGRWRTAAERDLRAVADALEAAQVLDLRERMLGALSGGQRQRVLIARALAQQSRVLLIDEPTSALDPAHQVRVLGLIDALRKEGKAVLVATHDVNLIGQLATRLVLLDRGRIAAEGTVEEVLRAPVLEPVYGACLYFGRWPSPLGERPFVLPRVGGAKESSGSM